MDPFLEVKLEERGSQLRVGLPREDMWQSIPEKSVFGWLSQLGRGCYWHLVGRGRVLLNALQYTGQPCAPLPPPQRMAPLGVSRAGRDPQPGCERAPRGRRPECSQLLPTQLAPAVPSSVKTSGCAYSSNFRNIPWLADRLFDARVCEVCACCEPGPVASPSRGTETRLLTESSPLTSGGMMTDMCSFCGGHHQ